MHLTDDEILLWHTAKHEMETARIDHARACEPCAALIADTANLIGELRKPATWSAPPRVAAQTYRVAELEQLADRLQFEEEEGRRRVERASPETLQELAHREPSVGLVRALIDASFASIERDPLLSQSLADMAVNAAASLNDEQYPPQIVATTRGAAWRQLANTHRMRGEMGKALAAVAAGAREFSQTAVPAPELASLDYIRAAVLYTQGAVAEARHILEKAIAVLQEFGDETRLRNSRLLLSIIYEREGERDEAVRLMRELLPTVPPGDTAFRGRVLMNLGVCLLYSDTGRAESYLQQGRRCLQLAGLRTEALRASWNLGRAALILEQYDRAAELLEDAYENAAAFGLVVDVAIIALYRAELLTKQGNHELISDLCSDALQTFQRAGARRFAAEAFTWVEKAARRRTLSIADLREVRHHIETGDPDAAFIPPNQLS